MKIKKILIIGVMILGIVSVTHSTPSGAVKSHLFFEYPIESISCTVNKSEYVDDTYGEQYTVDGIDGVYFAYVKRNILGLYYWSGGGSGP